MSEVLGGKRFADVPLRNRLQTRAAARRAWIRAKGRGDEAALLLRSDPDFVEIDPALIALLVQIALALFAYWFSMAIEQPSVVPDSSEPISWEESNDAD